MNGDHSLSTGRGVTLNDLKDQLYSLNMWMLLAMQNHDEQAQADIREQMAAVQEEMDRMLMGRQREPPSAFDTNSQ